MPRKTGLLAALLLTCVVAAHAQHAGSQALVVQIHPEARLEPGRIMLNFRVSADGASDVASQTAGVTAWVRALPGQGIHLTARIAGLAGPNGPVPATAVLWSGSAARATAGGQSATCSSGAFQKDVPQDLALGWQRSGILACAVRFDLAAPRSLPPGLYAGTVELALSAIGIIPLNLSQ